MLVQGGNTTSILVVRPLLRQRGRYLVVVVAAVVAVVDVAVVDVVGPEWE